MSWNPLPGAELRRRFQSDALCRTAITDGSRAVTDGVGWAAYHPWVRGWEEAGITVGATTVDVTAAVAALAPTLVELPQPIGFISTDPAARYTLPAGWHDIGSDGRWEFMTATHVETRTAAVPIVTLDDARDAAEIAAFNARHNPKSEGQPGTGRSELWLGMRDPIEESLIAVGALQRLETGVPYLAGLVVAADRRGEGLGGALLVELSRRALADAAEVTLGVDTENTGAIELYRRLGYATAARFSSRGLRFDSLPLAHRT